jgi:hypothetical protein
VRWFPLSGLVFVGFFAAAVGLYGSGAGTGQSEIVAYYALETDRLRQIAGFAALLAGCLFLLLYIAALAHEVGEGAASTVVRLSGGAATLLLATGNALWAASAFTTELERDYRINAQTHLLIEDAGFAVIVSGMALAIPCVAAASLALTHSKRLPHWFRLLGALAVAGLAAAYWYWPIGVFLAWIGCGSVLLARSPRPFLDAAEASAAET